MKKILALMLVLSALIAVLSACGEDEISYVGGTETQTNEVNSASTEQSKTQADTGDDTENGENRAEQTFGGMQELKPLH